MGIPTPATSNLRSGTILGSSQSGRKIEPDLRLGYQSFLLACGDCFEILQGRPPGGGYLTNIWHRSAAEGLKP